MRPCVLRTLPEKRSTLPDVFNTHYDEVVGLFEDIWFVEQDGLQLIKSRISPYGFRKNLLDQLMSSAETLTFMQRGVDLNGKLISLIGFDIVGG